MLLQLRVQGLGFMEFRTSRTQQVPGVAYMVLDEGWCRVCPPLQHGTGDTTVSSVSCCANILTSTICCHVAPALLRRKHPRPQGHLSESTKTPVNRTSNSGFCISMLSNLSRKASPWFRAQLNPTKPRLKGKQRPA